MTFYFCFAAWNEERELPRLLSRIHVAGSKLNMPYRIIAYDDGSRDRTREILESEDAAIVQILPLQPVGNRGLGAGILALIQHVSGIADTEDLALFF